MADSFAAAVQKRTSALNAANAERAAIAVSMMIDEVVADFEASTDHEFRRKALAEMGKIAVGQEPKQQAPQAVIPLSFSIVLDPNVPQEPVARRAKALPKDVEDAVETTATQEPAAPAELSSDVPAEVLPLPQEPPMDLPLLALLSMDDE